MDDEGRGDGEGRGVVLCDAGVEKDGVGEGWWLEFGEDFGGQDLLGGFVLGLGEVGAVDCY